MSDFTVFDVAFPADAKQRVIVNTDAKGMGKTIACSRALSDFREYTLHTERGFTHCI